MSELIIPLGSGSHDYDMLFKLLVVGDSGVGKSSISKRFAENRYHPSFITTIGVDFSVTTMHHSSGKKIKLQIWDTAGQERFRAITRAYWGGADGICLVYDVSDPESLANIRDVWIPEMLMYARKDVKLLLVGNKTDLLRKGFKKDPLCDVLVEELCDERRMQSIMTSAKDNSNVNKAFEALVDELAAQRARTMELYGGSTKRFKLKGKPVKSAHPLKECCPIG